MVKVLVNGVQSQSQVVLVAERELSELVVEPTSPRTEEAVLTAQLTKCKLLEQRLNALSEFR